MICGLHDDFMAGKKELKGIVYVTLSCKKLGPLFSKLASFLCFGIQLLPFQNMRRTACSLWDLFKTFVVWQPDLGEWEITGPCNQWISTWACSPCTSAGPAHPHALSPCMSAGLVCALIQPLWKQWASVSGGLVHAHASAHMPTACAGWAVLTCSLTQLWIDRGPVVGCGPGVGNLWCRWCLAEGRWIWWCTMFKTVGRVRRL